MRSQKSKISLESTLVLPKGRGKKEFGGMFYLWYMVRKFVFMDPELDCTTGIRSFTDLLLKKTMIAFTEQNSDLRLTITEVWESNAWITINPRIWWDRPNLWWVSLVVKCKMCRQATHQQTLTCCSPLGATQHPCKPEVRQEEQNDMSCKCQNKSTFSCAWNFL